MLRCVCSVTDHRRHQKVVRTSVSSIVLCATFLFLPHFNIICDQLVNRRAAIWNLFVKCYCVVLITINNKNKILQNIVICECLADLSPLTNHYILRNLTQHEGQINPGSNQIRFPIPIPTPVFT